MSDSTASTTTAPSAPTASSSGVKETIESILIAFILAFIFRAFIVEAFVIPTGSMAPTLLGAHVRETCQDCGWVYDVNVSSPTNQTSDDPQVPPYLSQASQSLCPNCGYINESPRGTPVRYGDRILVLKYLDTLRSFGLIDYPHRWDVIVFKAPFKAPYQQNYIKRLVGLPGESVLILDGDIYTAPVHATDINQFHIQPKTEEAQTALWRIIYDNDHLPRGLGSGRTAGLASRGFNQPWKVRSGDSWQLTHDAKPARQFTFDGADQTGVIYFDRDANRPDDRDEFNYPLTDWLAYDFSDTGYRRSLRPYVSDLKLDLYYTRQSGSGPLELRLTKRDDTFVAQITTDGVRLLRRSAPGHEQILSESSQPLSANRTVHLQFSNCDYVVKLKIDDQTVLQTTPAQYAPDTARLLSEFHAGLTAPAPMVEIAASNQQAQIQHLSLWHDIFYINQSNSHSLLWAVPSQFPNHVVHLNDTPGREEYFVLGDNSPISWDARYWSDPVSLPAEDLPLVEAGRVPQRFLLGRAFFVYWPAGYAFLQGSPALVPNFGEMRFIH
ncbi:MAG: hypothetical protein IT448_08450 [Phycisphaerales bacterium]|nr:hypothetical protein [Phycisphaerales bacterium]